MSQRAIPLLLFRGRTSAGPCFRMDVLPLNHHRLADVGIAAGIMRKARLLALGAVMVPRDV
ncbi:hypothetical protein [Shinella oryzae]|uniref:hypothetical protein n=1 Tax=Shinella oryzae TaxID=2871820 RepID=UPI001FF48901|nr:hypothetical protein [Shinella oryzae]UPA27684.1 hypothetical protein K6301_19280 [Shinella oryzae]